MALHGPPTYCGAGHFWHAWYFQMRMPVDLDKIDRNKA